ncbi:hypothetical protein KIH79_02550 [Bifidobacterium sp. 82T10]|uniref:Uncharacterized protein n=1 Tax=Bifidobacterium miconis TaxID=2834435 RepID=A0ABS6WE15_9BIFI|nr:hypothetical protein [Bifidobacterium miconis]MBW3091849.1 hypothetical protein [Bifidobacterium miconis]
MSGKERAPGFMDWNDQQVEWFALIEKIAKKIEDTYKAGNITNCERQKLLGMVNKIADDIQQSNDGILSESAWDDWLVEHQDEYACGQSKA